MINWDQILGHLGPGEDMVRGLIGKPKAPDPITMAQGGFGQPAVGPQISPQIPTAVGTQRRPTSQYFPWWQYMGRMG